MKKKVTQTISSHFYSRSTAEYNRFFRWLLLGGKRRWKGYSVDVNNLIKIIHLSGQMTGDNFGEKQTLCFVDPLNEVHWGSPSSVDFYTHFTSLFSVAIHWTEVVEFRSQTVSSKGKLETFKPFVALIPQLHGFFQQLLAHNSSGSQRKHPIFMLIIKQ
jgi:hypothetical protein